MLRSSGLLVALALAAGCDHATGPVDSSSAAASLATVAKPVDPAALTPAPAPPMEAECKADGNWIICHTTVLDELVEAQDGDFGCGMIYENSTNIRYGIRWYDAADSVIVKRNVTQHVQGTLSLSPDGTGPTVTITADDNWHDSQYADVNDLETGVRSYHGDGLKLQAPGYGVILHVAGQDTPEGTHHGVSRFLEDPAVIAELCAALWR